MIRAITAVVMSLIASTCLGGTPASKDYVNQQIALAKADLLTTINSTPSIAHPVGSCYGGGVVFYVNTTPNAPVGQQGLVAALTDVSNSTYQWDTSGTLALLGTSNALFTGASNTTLILNSPDGQAGRTQAAIAANAYTDGVYHDWYLPSQGEITVLQVQARTTTNLFTACGGSNPSTINQYWSSSQYDTSDSSYVSFGNGVVYVTPNTTLYLVRAVRAF